LIFDVLETKKDEKALVFIGKTHRLRNDTGDFFSFSLGNNDFFDFGNEKI